MRMAYRYRMQRAELGWRVSTCTTGTLQVTGYMHYWYLIGYRYVT